MHLIIGDNNISIVWMEIYISMELSIICLCFKALNIALLIIHVITG